MGERLWCFNVDHKLNSFNCPIIVLFLQLRNLARYFDMFWPTISTNSSIGKLLLRECEMDFRKFRKLRITVFAKKAIRKAFCVTLE